MEHLPTSSTLRLRRVHVNVEVPSVRERKPSSSASFQGSSLPKASLLILSCAAANRVQRRRVVRRQQLSPTTTTNPLNSPTTTTNPLNPRQQEAVSAELKRHALIIAGAGSGKTTVLAQRLVWLLKEGIDPTKVVLLTFTKSAAEEMKTRARHLVGTKADSVLACTFHSFCSRVLRKYGQCIQIPNDFIVLSEPDARTTISLARRKLGFENKSRQSGFPQPRVLKDLFSRKVSMGEEFRVILQEGKYRKYADYAEDIELCQQEYEKQKKVHGMLDFDDLQVKCQELLQNEQICKKVAKECQYILVDEYQDTDQRQDAILRSIIAHNSTLTVVGDDAQGIYGFRGAAIENIHNFEENYPDVNVYKLEQNYRSDPPILELANNIMSLSSKGYSKRLFSKRQGSNLPKLCHFIDNSAEATWVVQQLQKLHHEGIAYRDMAVLFRRRKSSARVEAELQTHHIPYHLVGGNKRVESKHARDLFALLHCVNTPRFMVAWKRVLLLINGIGEKTAEQIFEDIFQEQRLIPEKWKGKSFFEDLSSLAKVLEEMHELNHDPEECVRLAKKWYDPYLILKYPDYEEQQERKEDFLVFEDMMSKWETLSIALQEMGLSENQEAQKDKDMVTLTTIHAAKGLEWNTVFIIDLQEQSRGMDQSEEELRVMYVGITRACRRLYLCCPGALLSTWLELLENLDDLVEICDLTPAVFFPRNRGGFRFR